MAKPRPLDDLTVVEYGDGVAMRFCTRLLARLGASVTKLTRPSGPAAQDDSGSLRTRAETVYLDQGKEELRLTTDPSDAEVFAHVRDADIVVRGLARGGAEARALRAEFDNWVQARTVPLVYAAVTPFGTWGASASWKGGDINAQALSGWPSITGNPGEEPLTMNYGVGAMLHGVHATAAVLGAIVGRPDQSRSEFVDVSEAEAVAASIHLYAATYRWARIPLVRDGFRAPGSSGRYPHTVFPCKDGLIAIILRSDEQWDRFIEMLGRPEWSRDPRYQDYYAMGTAYPAEVDALVVPWFRARTKAEISEIARKYSVPLGAVRTLDEVLEDEQLAYRGFFETCTVAGREVSLPTLPVWWRTATTRDSGQKGS